ncbi:MULTISPECIES: hypothetical protein [Xanthomonas]|nr:MULTISPECIES: hypothetical protein [Xanthomonas]KLC64093.1 hypothetical protein GEV872_04285 [Xanthomonas perforans]KLC68845.1 hypothetical protein GEV893_10215 [Xanthomonas perforans]KLC72513.1 hypothetical protein GEV909_17890 [Xanthomonas perforans]KLC80187.1 hypothetical protein GEV915_11975 [Xanthomonas perforans]KLC80764.1 hypothetical protein GEV904_04970 [Xanthomonas perforans]
MEMTDANDGNDQSTPEEENKERGSLRQTEHKARHLIAELVENPAILEHPAFRAVMLSQSYSGPTPPAEEFAGYERAVPGAGLQLLDLSKSALASSVRINERAQELDYEEARRGQWMAYTLALATIAGAVALGMIGEGWPGALFGTGGLAAIVYLFIQGKKR